MNLTTGQDKAIEFLRQAKGVLHTNQILRAGIHRRDLYALRKAGIFEAISRGVFRLSDLPRPAEPDLVVVASRIPKAVVCLISALHFHGLTAEIPRLVSIALPRGSSRPRLDWPPLAVHWFSSERYERGIEIHERDGVRIRVYNPAKTVVDCFRFRNKLGIDVALEALKSGLGEGRFTPADIMRFARICRVEKAVRPFLEALQ